MTELKDQTILNIFGEEEFRVIHRFGKMIENYFVSKSGDVYSGKTKKMIIEVKPEKQTKPPSRSKLKPKSYLRESFEFAKNQAKWKAMNEWCLDRKYEFKILTENELGIK